MKKRAYLRIILVTGIFCSFLVTMTTAWSQEGKIIPEKKLQGHQVISLQAISGINPPSVTVDSGTTVIWLNYSREMAEIQFTGKEVTIACDKPVHFVVDAQGSFISDKIPLGAVASLCFIEKGTFDYTVKRESPTPYSRTEEFKGKVIVR